MIQQAINSVASTIIHAPQQAALQTVSKAVADPTSEAASRLQEAMGQKRQQALKGTMPYQNLANDAMIYTKAGAFTKEQYDAITPEQEAAMEKKNSVNWEERESNFKKDVGTIWGSNQALESLHGRGILSNTQYKKLSHALQAHSLAEMATWMIDEGKIRPATAEENKADYEAQKKKLEVNL